MWHHEYIIFHNSAFIVIHDIVACWNLQHSLHNHPLYSVHLFLCLGSSCSAAAAKVLALASRVARSSSACCLWEMTRGSSGGGFQWYKSIWTLQWNGLCQNSSSQQSRIFGKMPFGGILFQWCLVEPNIQPSKEPSSQNHTKSSSSIQQISSKKRIADLTVANLGVCVYTWRWPTMLIWLIYC